MKRSRSVMLLSMGVSALALTACGEDQSDALLYQSVQQCLADGKVSREDCLKGAREAKQQHAAVAPKYRSKADCEADFGEGKCETAPYRTTAGGSVFMPLLVGYMMGRTLGGGARGFGGQPLYRSKDDPKNFRTADNKSVGARTGAVKVPRSTTAAPARKLYTMRRGGFGASGRSLSSRPRSYGGRGYGGRSYGG